MRLSILVCTLFIFGCKQYSEDAVINPNWKVLGHGGAGFDVTNAQHPPNSMRSIQQALFYYGADGVEVDLKMTLDSTLILFHDEQLETATNGYGKVEEQLASTIREYAYRKTFGPEKVDIALASDLLSLLKTLETPVVVSFQLSQTQPSDDFINTLVRSFIHMIEEIPSRHTILVESDHLALLEKIKIRNAAIRTYLVYDFFDQEHIEKMKNKIDGYSSYFGSLTMKDIVNANREGLDVMVYGLKIRKDVVDVLDWPLQYVQLDNLNLTQ